MRIQSTLGLLIFGLCALIVVTPFSLGQPNSKGNKSSGKKGGFGDPKTDFDRMADGKPYFLLSQVQGFGATSLAEFAKEKNITNGQITFALYQEYRDQQKARWMERMQGKTPGGAPSGSGVPNFGKGPTPGNTPPGSGRPGVITAPPIGVTVLQPKDLQNSSELNELSDREFRKRDDNEDGKLNRDEMQGSLRENLSKFDTDMDGLIDLNEYRAFYKERLERDVEKNNKGKKSNAPIIIIEEDNWDVRPKVLRAGNLHPDLPSWFKELDTDVDGQVALFEWRLKKPIDEFRTWDVNSDGFVTQEEALKIKGAVTGTKKVGPGGAVASSSSPGSEKPSFRGFGPPGSGQPGMGQPGSGNPFGGFMDRMKKGNKGGRP